jgi:hypothetical protein
MQGCGTGKVDGVGVVDAAGIALQDAVGAQRE